MKKTVIFWAILIFGILISNGCIKTEYVCLDGRSVADPSLCGVENITVGEGDYCRATDEGCEYKKDYVKVETKNYKICFNQSIVRSYKFECEEGICKEYVVSEVECMVKCDTVKRECI